MRPRSIFLVTCLSFGMLACSSSSERASSSDPNAIRIDGSSTVFPLSEVVADAYREAGGGPVAIDASGTGGGFRLFCAGETHVQGASRPISDAEAAECARNEVTYVEIPVAYDGVVVAVHSENHWASWMSVDELRRVFAASGSARRWSDVREGWPSRDIHVYAPGRDSGTYDFFTDVVLGTPGSMRAADDASEDDAYLVRRVRRDPDGIAFFGYAYFATNRGVLDAVAVNDGNELNGAGAVAPSVASIADGTYQPLSRPLLLYVSSAALERDDVARFVQLYVDRGNELAIEASMVPLRPRGYELAAARLRARTTGSAFAHARLGEALTVEQLLE